MFEKLLKAGAKATKNYVSEGANYIQEFREYDGITLMAMYKENDFSARNIAIKSVLKEKGYNI